MFNNAFSCLYLAVIFDVDTQAGSGLLRVVRFSSRGQRTWKFRLGHFLQMDDAQPLDEKGRVGGTTACTVTNDYYVLSKG